jgi:hypothetical protein
VSVVRVAAALEASQAQALVARQTPEAVVVAIPEALAQVVLEL